MKLAALLAIVAAVFALGCNVYTPPTVPLAPPTARVTADVEAGYRRYSEPLAAFGTWEADASFGTHWCPRGAKAMPFADHGHWAPSDHEIGKAPAGVPTWKSDEPWGDVTFHHGYWTRTKGGASDSWCWVPGEEETPARVVWREGGGFVGWAPEEPDTRVDDDVDFGELDWMYQLVSELYDLGTGACPLQDEAKRIAEYATSRMIVARVAHVGPNRDAVIRAMREMDAYRAAHPHAVANGGDGGHSSGGSSNGSNGSSASGSSGGGGSLGGHAGKSSGINIGGSSSGGGSVKVFSIGGIKFVVSTDVMMMPPPMPFMMPPPEYYILDRGGEPVHASTPSSVAYARLPGSDFGDRYASSQVGGHTAAFAGGYGNGGSGSQHGRGGSHGSHGHGGGSHGSHGGGSHVSFGHGLFHFHR